MNPNVDEKGFALQIRSLIVGIRNPMEIAKKIWPLFSGLIADNKKLRLKVDELAIELEKTTDLLKKAAAEAKKLANEKISKQKRKPKAPKETKSEPVAGD